MANPGRGEVDVVLVGLGPRRLVFDYNAIADISESVDMSNPEKAPLSFLRAALAAGLSRDNRIVTPRQAGSILQKNQENMTEIARAISLGILRYHNGPDAKLPEAQESEEVTIENPTTATPVP
jgi:hypothetical protein